VAARAVGGSRQDSRFRRGLLLDDPAKPEAYALITERGMHMTGRSLEIKRKQDLASYTAGTLLETSVAFEHFQLRRK